MLIPIVVKWAVIVWTLVVQDINLQNYAMERNFAGRKQIHTRAFLKRDSPIFTTFVKVSTLFYFYIEHVEK